MRGDGCQQSAVGGVTFSLRGLGRIESLLMDDETRMERYAFVKIDDVLVHQPHASGRRRLPDPRPLWRSVETIRPCSCCDNLLTERA